MPDVIMRRARIEDVDKIVPLIYSSGPNAFDYVFENGDVTAEGFLKSAYLASRNGFSHRQHWVAQYQGDVVGSMVCYRQETFLKLTVANAARIILQYGVSALNVMLNGVRVETTVHPPVAGRLYLGHLGVDPALRGNGIGKQLLLHAEEIAREQGISILALDVADTNTRAKELYEREDYKVIEERPFKYNKAGKPKVPNHFYMEKML